MPNYCEGRLTIFANDNTINSIQTLLKGKDEEGEEILFDFNKVIPMPENIYRGPIGKKEEELYGKNTWYYWSIENWGTKWNSIETEICGNVYYFYTAWSPCSPVIKALAALFPEAKFDFWYEETGNCFCGHEVYLNGKLFMEYCVNIDPHFDFDNEEEDPEIIQENQTA